MRYELCPDGTTLVVNGDGKLQVGNASGMVLTDQGYASNNALGYVRDPNGQSFGTDGIYFTDPVDYIVAGSSVRTSKWTYVASWVEPPYPEGDPVAYGLAFFSYKLVLGAGFVFPATGKMSYSLTYYTGAPPTLWDAVVKLTDVSAGTVRYGTLKERRIIVNNANVTPTSPWTWAVGDTIEISGHFILEG